jgi:hypothetical protein
MNDDLTGITLVNDINTEHQLFEGSMRNGLEHAVRCGQLLIKQKATLSHGEWLPWIMLNCEFAINRADVYMRLASAKLLSREQFKEVTSIRSALRLLNEPKPKKALPPPVEITFTWVKEPHYIAMEEGKKPILACVSIMQNTDRDPEVAKYLLEMLGRSLIKIASDISGKLGKDWKDWGPND